MRSLVFILALLLSCAPLAAQEELPAGCNLGIMGEIFGSTAQSLNEQELNLPQALFVIDALDDALEALRAACLGQGGAAADSPDYSAIHQTRAADGGFLLGDPEAAVTIVEFADFLCPACQRYHNTVKQLVEREIASGRARLEYRFLPVIDATHPPLTASLVECSGRLAPGSFWDAVDIMYELTTAGYNGLTPITFASRAGLDYQALAGCVAAGEHQVLVDAALAQEAGVSSTPTVLLRYGDGELEAITDSNGRRINSGSVPLFVLESVIEEAQG